MDGDAVREIAKLEREKKNWFQVPSEPSDVYYLIDDDGTSLRIVAEHLHPEITCYSTEALLTVAKVQDDEGGHVEIYYSAYKVQVVVCGVDDNLRIRRHTLPLPLHPVFNLLTGLSSTRTFTQRELIRFSRAELNGNVNEGVVEQFRHLNLSSHGEGSSVIDKGRAGVSRSLMQSVKGSAGDVPDLITVTAPVYDIDEMLHEPFEVKLLIDCVPDAEGKPVFELTTVHSTLQQAKHSALEVIAERLKAGDFPVIYGQAS